MISYIIGSKATQKHFLTYLYTSVSYPREPMKAPDLYISRKVCKVSFEIVFKMGAFFFSSVFD